MVPSKIYPVIISLIILNVSCMSSLKVRVDVLDRQAMIESIVYKRGELNELCMDVFKRLDRIKFDTLGNRIDSDLEIAFQKLELGNQPLTLTQQAVKKEWEKVLDQNRMIYESLLSSCTDEVEDENLTAIMARYQSEFSKADQNIKSFQNDLCENFNTLLSESGRNMDCPQLFKDTKALKALFTKPYYQENTFGASIINDKYASLVTRVPEKYWKRYRNRVNITTTDNLADYKVSSSKRARINFTKVCTFLGNADIAIKMDSPGSFTVKGVRLDASEVIKASFDVFQQGIKYLAYSNGIGVKDPASSTGKERTISQIPDIQQNKLLKSQIIHQNRSTDADLKALLSVIFSQEKNILNDTTADARIMARENILKALESYKATTQNSNAD